MSLAFIRNAAVAAVLSLLSLGSVAAAAEPTPAVAEMIARATSGDTSALVPLGFAYLAGNGVDADIDEATRLFREAIAKNVPGAAKALMVVGYALQGRGEGEESLAIFQEAADAGSVDALLPLGFAYQSGSGVAKDEARGVALLKQAADGDVSGALIPLGFAYLSGTGIEKDLAAATAIFEKAVAAKVDNAADALMVVGYNYQTSKAAADKKTALAVFQRAADAGAAKALMPLAFAYQSGSGVKADKSKANKLFAQAMQAGVADAAPLVYFADANEYVRLLQLELIDRGFLEGTANGRANSLTIRAFTKFCASEKLTKVCRAGPFAVPVMKAVTPVLWPAPAKAS